MRADARTLCFASQINSISTVLVLEFSALLYKVSVPLFLAVVILEVLDAATSHNRVVFFNDVVNLLRKERHRTVLKHREVVVGFKYSNLECCEDIKSGLYISLAGTEVVLSTVDGDGFSVKSVRPVGK